MFKDALKPDFLLPIFLATLIWTMNKRLLNDLYFWQISDFMKHETFKLEKIDSKNFDNFNKLK